MIHNFRDEEAEKLFDGKNAKRYAGIARPARRRLEMLNAAVSLQDLKAPPGNHLEKLQGDRDGWYSIRINDQWRICFRWGSGQAYDVEIKDYH